MRRRLSTLLSAVSLVLCARWVRSYWKVVGVSWADAARIRTLTVVCTRGRVGALAGHARPGQQVYPPGGTSDVPVQDPFDLADEGQGKGVNRATVRAGRERRGCRGPASRYTGRAMSRPPHARSPL